MVPPREQSIFNSGALGSGEKRNEKNPRLAQAFSIRADEVFEFCFIVAGAMCSLLLRHYGRYTWNLAVKIAIFEIYVLELQNGYSNHLNSLENVFERPQPSTTPNDTYQVGAILGDNVKTVWYSYLCLNGPYNSATLFPKRLSRLFSPIAVRIWGSRRSLFTTIAAPTLQ